MTVPDVRITVRMGETYLHAGDLAKFIDALAEDDKIPDHNKLLLMGISGAIRKLALG